jgi:hypothetical protein
VRKPGGDVDEAKRASNREKSKVRARVEHVFGVIKRLWGFTKVRYRGLDKNAGRAFVALALANLYLARKPLLGQVIVVTDEELAAAQVAWAKIAGELSSGSMGPVISGTVELTGLLSQILGL